MLLEWIYLSYKSDSVALKYTKTNLKKIEEIFTSNDFVIRYERGQFQSGYCILRDKKIIIINKFFKEKGRIESLLDITQLTELDKSKINEEGLKLLKIAEKSYLAEME